MVRVDGREVEIACPFPSPADWRDCWIYFVLVPGEALILARAET